VDISTPLVMDKMLGETAAWMLGVLIAPPVQSASKGVSEK